MTTSDLVARLTARANLTYSYPIEDILLLRGAANEIERLREALQDIFDYECRTSSTSLIACTARDALWPRAALAETGEK